MSNFHPLKVGRGSGTQIQMGEYLNTYGNLAGKRSRLIKCAPLSFPRPVRCLLITLGKLQLLLLLTIELGDHISLYSVCLIISETWEIYLFLWTTICNKSRISLLDRKKMAQHRVNEYLKNTISIILYKNTNPKCIQHCFVDFRNQKKDVCVFII